MKARRHALSWLLGLGMGSASMLFASPAHAAAASCRPVTNAIIEYLNVYLPEQIELYMDNLEMTMEYLTEASGDQDSAQIGRAGDAIIDGITQQHNHKVQLETEPRPSACTDARTQAALETVSQAAEAEKAHLIAEEMCRVQTQNHTEARKDRVDRHRQLREFEDVGFSDIAAETLLNPVGYRYPELAQDFIHNLLGETAHLAREGLDERTATPREAAYRHNRDVYQIRVATILDAVYTIFTDRLRSPAAGQDIFDTATPHENAILSDMGVERDQGFSVLDIYEFEIRRTYGSIEWRDRIAQYGASTPVTKELARLKSIGRQLQDRLASQESQKAVLESLLGMSELEDKAPGERPSSPRSLEPVGG
ncbi:MULTISPECIES: hypothetical protein [unclassified Thioalkalivibrio]|uniref:hypothetical protein n=1 Tax=unclassified Thioalkalivibrio TaxID=2621013 RepID=UPI0003714ABA|nr:MULTISPECIES: hypothetical protein [unclassified Thioalkalivibrio]